MIERPTEFQLKLMGYRLITAEIIYRMPDYKSLLQEFIWQQYDIAPQFPALNKFIAFWEENLDGPIHSLRIDHSPLIAPSDFKAYTHEITLQ